MVKVNAGLDAKFVPQKCLYLMLVKHYRTNLTLLRCFREQRHDGDVGPTIPLDRMAPLKAVNAHLAFF